MNEIKTTSHAGDVSISRRLNVGGKATIRGNATFDHDVVIKGWLDATNIKGPLKGLFPTVEALKQTYIEPEDGWFALVGDTLPAAVYRAEDGVWTATGKQGGEFTVDLTAIKGDISDLDDMLKGVIVNLDIETEERKGADTALSDRITTETKERKAADEALQKALSTETTERKQAVEALQTAVTKETEERKGADTALSDRITTETKERKAADEALQKALSTETSQRKDIDDVQDANILELQKAVWPLELTLRCDKSIAEVGQPTDLHFTWSVKRKGADVTSECVVTLNGTVVSGTEKTMSVTVPAYRVETYTIVATYKGMRVEGSVSVAFVNKSYWSVVGREWEPTAANIKVLVSHLQASRKDTVSDIRLEVERMVYAYPAVFGVLSSIKDGNGYEVIDSYRAHALTIDGIDYLAYILETPVSAEGVTQIYT